MNRDEVVQIALDVIAEWQGNPRVHPATCGCDSNHPPLVGEDVDGAVRLRCLVCDWSQALPRTFVDLITERLREAAEGEHTLVRPTSKEANDALKRQFENFTSDQIAEWDGSEPPQDYLDRLVGKKS